MYKLLYKLCAKFDEMPRKPSKLTIQMPIVNRPDHSHKTFAESFEFFTKSCRPNRTVRSKKLCELSKTKFYFLHLFVIFQSGLCHLFLVCFVFLTKNFFSRTSVSTSFFSTRDFFSLIFSEKVFGQTNFLCLSVLLGVLAEDSVSSVSHWLNHNSKIIINHLQILSLMILSGARKSPLSFRC